MVEDIQIEMQQSASNQVALSLQNQTQKRAPGGIMSLQLDSSKNGNVGGIPSFGFIYILHFIVQ